MTKQQLSKTLNCLGAGFLITSLLFNAASLLTSLLFNPASLFTHIGFADIIATTFAAVATSLFIASQFVLYFYE